MRKFRLIPAIDLLAGKCVRLTQGNYAQPSIYHNDPLYVAQTFEGVGIEYLHLVDLDGAKAGKVINWRVLENICRKTQLKVDFGGGLRTLHEARQAFDAGATQITGGSIAVKNTDLFEEWLQIFGSERVILGVDVKDGRVAIHGWKDTSEWQLADFVEHYLKKGVRYVISTDIAKDGMLQGAATDLYQALQQQFADLRIIASGGVASMADVTNLAQMGLEGVIFGKAFYEGNISLADLKNWNP